MDTVIPVLCLVSSFAFLMIRFKYELQMMQQNSYRNDRYAKWLKSDLSSINRILISGAFVISAIFLNHTWLKIIITLFSVAGIFYELTRKYKKALVYTHRAIRLHLTASLVSLLSVAAAFFFTGNFNVPLLTVWLLDVLSFAVLMLSNKMNAPVESAINRGYRKDAKRILEQHKDLIVIGITGSYGKTSTKHYLHRILSEKYNVLMTPGSYNTTLGVIRTVREHLKSCHEVFIVEMGAKQTGDIKEICDLVHPSIGILTSVGEQHLESFKTIENVQKTKFELIDSLPENGLAVLNADFEHITSRRVNHVKTFYYSFSNDRADCHIEDVRYSNSGTSFTVKQKDGTTDSFSTKITGRHNLSDILAGILVAGYLNVEKNATGYAVNHIEQVEHRLNIRQTQAGITIIDDAYNSNPHGAEMALEVLKGFQSGKRIIVTPGMIELGDRQFDCNYTFGKQLSDAADYVIIVGAYNREAIVKGLKDGGFDEEKLYQASSFNDAMKHINPRLAKGDVILYENDLPDTFK
ncbi:MAG: UDP-N-acetylmuramoyl-tripeptide--D-alanyl-D-alanine ligase [Tannerella sp.]|jgi:UDP-N-acetylmuramoyl-tripeptide--D-alanyl-D-alanine ligase|nr:UDP-N-acetylmuramoyl-tripeptide--D-alanyl-D-alanine ligase [Tannerella sp.]